MENVHFATWNWDKLKNEYSSLSTFTDAHFFNVKQLKNSCFNGITSPIYKKSKLRELVNASQQQFDIMMGQYFILTLSFEELLYYIFRIKKLTATASFTTSPWGCFSSSSIEAGDHLPKTNSYTLSPPAGVTRHPSGSSLRQNWSPIGAEGALSPDGNSGDLGLFPETDLSGNFQEQMGIPSPKWLCKAPVNQFGFNPGLFEQQVTQMSVGIPYIEDDVSYPIKLTTPIKLPLFFSISNVSTNKYISQNGEWVTALTPSQVPNVGSYSLNFLGHSISPLYTIATSFDYAAWERQQTLTERFCTLPSTYVPFQNNASATANYSVAEEWVYP